jgi:hypothetical protein
LISAEPTGDSTLKLEKFLLEWVSTSAHTGHPWADIQAETVQPLHLEDVLSVVDKPLKARNSSYQWIILRAAVDT